ncbi:MAG: alanine racemase [Erythrobacter sp.]
MNTPLIMGPDAPFDEQTPALLVDEAKFTANLERMRAHAQRVRGDVQHRPHLKTVKSVPLAKRITGALQTPAVTVSTLKEAEIFAAAGYRDILYAVGIAPAKLARVKALRDSGVDLVITTDNVETAQAIAAFSQQSGEAFPVLIEIDCDGHRSGIPPEDTEQLLAVGRALAQGAEIRSEVRGVMTHAGGSYSASTPEELAACAAREREGAVLAAHTLRSDGHAAPVVSIGSTPTAFGTSDLTGVTELRAGVYPFFDLVMAGIGVCTPDEIAVSVLSTVIGHQRDKGWIIVDAGWMAMSRDRGTAGQRVDQGYGLVCSADGAVMDNLIMVSANQEHGIIAVRAGAEEGADAALALPDLPVGTQLRILPNHACATAAQFDHYTMFDEPGGPVTRVERFSGW